MSINRRRSAAINQTLYYDNQVNNMFKPFNGIVVPLSPPVGSITAFTGMTAPLGWLICDGSEVNRNKYVSLFDAIGTTFGPGDNHITFNLPNYMGAFLRGTGTKDNYSGPDVNMPQNHATQKHLHLASSTVTDPGHVHSQSSLNDDFNNSTGAYPGTVPSFPAYDSVRVEGPYTWNNVNNNTTGITVATTVANSTTSVVDNETRPYNYGVCWIIKF